MKQYLLSVYQPDGDPPAPEVLETIMRDLDALNQELKAAGAWVFAGGLHAPSTATVVRLKDGEVLTTDREARQFKDEAEVSDPACRPSPHRSSNDSFAPSQRNP